MSTEALLVFISQQSLIPLPQLLDMSWAQVWAISRAMTELKSRESQSSTPDNNEQSKNKVLSEQQADKKLRDLLANAKKTGKKLTLADML